MAERYVGIDLNEKYAVISYYATGMSEPKTFSSTADSEVYRIPLCIAKKKETDSGIYGGEAERLSKEAQTLCVDGLLQKALAEESVEFGETRYEAKELLFLFIKKLLELLPQSKTGLWPDKLVIVTEIMDRKSRNLFGSFAEWAKIRPESLLLLGCKESFYYYALSQTSEMNRFDVALCHYRFGKMFCWMLSRDKRTVPQVVTIEESCYEAAGKERDEEFAEIAEALLAKRIVSCVYLVGDEFDGGWMKRSLNVICRGRRVFMGENLFSKGACYAAVVRTGKKKWPYVYMGDDELRTNVGLQVEYQGKNEYLSLITAGENWYEAGGEYDVILSGSPSVDFLFQAPDSREAVARVIELPDLPKREDKMTRLRISVKPLAVDKIRLCILDLGFGEFAQTSDKIWEYETTL